MTKLPWLATTRPDTNGGAARGIRQHVPGVITLAGWFSIIVTAVGAPVGYIRYVERRLDATEAAQVRADSAQANTIKVAIADALKDYKGVPRDEWETWKQTQALQGGSVREDIRALRNEFRSDSMYNRNILSRLPGAVSESNR